MTLIDLRSEQHQKFQELTTIEFGVEFIKSIMELGCVFRSCEFFADVHFNGYRMEIHVPVMERKLSLITSAEGSFDPDWVTYNGPSEKFLQDINNYNSFVNALIDFSSKAGISTVQCSTKDANQLNVLFSLGFAEISRKLEPGLVTMGKPVPTEIKTPIFYNLDLLKQSFLDNGLELTKIFFAAMIDFSGLGDYAGRLGRLEYRYRLIEGNAVLSIFDAMDFLGVNGTTQLFKEYLEECYGMPFKLIK
jgi:hypothetical protein